MLLLLMGPPGSGKTSLGRSLAKRLSYKWIDVDDHLLEPEWKCSVGHKLSQLGEKLFIKEEGRVVKEAALTFVPSTVVSLSGSNPMDMSVMQALQNRKDAVFIYLDIHLDDIVRRLQKMKVDRIVGNSQLCCGGSEEEPSINGSEVGLQIKQLVDRRAVFYDPWFDVRVWPKEGVTLQELEECVLDGIDAYMKARCDAFTSTRCFSVPPYVGLAQALLGGLAKDGGLYVPKKGLSVKLTSGQLKRLAPLGYRHKAHIVLEQLIHRSHISPQKLDKAINESYSQFQHSKVVPVVHLKAQQLYIAELFHGPSGSFKDLSLQLLPKIVSHLLMHKERHLYVVATSGDTGSAVIEGFAALNHPRLAVLVMYPTNGISAVQKQQMVTCNAPNVSVVGVKGNFDDCQRMLKAVLTNKLLKKWLLKNYSVTLNTANSINWGRILPQIIFHVHSYLELVNEHDLDLGQPVDVCIPSGNFGNMLSAIYARQMGIPYANIICASNDNHVLTDFFSTGTYDLRDRPFHRTISPAIDILVSSNLERHLWMTLGSKRVTELMDSLKKSNHYSLEPNELEQVADGIKAGWCSETECKETIQNLAKTSGYVADPHTAVAVHVAQRFQRPSFPMMVMSTAHPAKFSSELQDVYSTLGTTDHWGVKKCLGKPTVHVHKICPSVGAIESFLCSFIDDYFTVTHEEGLELVIG